MFDVKLQFSESVVRAAALASWRRAFGIRFVFALVLVGGSLAALVGQGDRSWFVGMLGTVLVFGSAFATVAYFVSVGSSLRRLRGMQIPEARFHGGPSDFTISSELGSIGLPWTAVKRVWRYPDFWLLVFSRSSQVTIPLAAIDAETRSFVLEQIAKAGGKVGA